MLTQKDFQQIGQRGITIDEINRQISYFKSGFPPADILMPATPGQGIICLSEREEEHYREVYNAHAPDSRITRFIPASGAATRMFKSLFEALDELEGKPGVAQHKWVEKHPEIDQFLEQLPEYPFFEDLNLPQGALPEEILRRVLSKPGLDYGSMPKGLLKFHKYHQGDRRTSLEEHLREAAAYCGNRDGTLRIHLTVSPDHLEGFRAEADRVLPYVEQETGLHIDLSFSFQKPETDTIAVDLRNEPFRQSDGSLLFRPGGHGALIRNLDALDSDLLFVSNIDNVAPDRTKPMRIRYKQVLGGILLEIRSQLFEFLNHLEGEEPVEKTMLGQMVAFLYERLGMAIPEGLMERDAAALRQWLISAMNRPMRVCGMVRNEGEPGGGPFYVRSESGEVSLQIVESSQIDMGDPSKAALVAQSTHFNPVDLVCSVRDYKGRKFSLTEYVDPSTGFISSKSMGGKELKALELPGLWNGAMAHWLTLFVEVPLETFSPVKTVFDLMRPEHLTWV